MKGSKRILIYDATPEFIENVSLAMQIDDEYPLDFAFITKNYSDFAICVKNNKNALDAILVNTERLPMMPKESDLYDIPIFFYTTNKDYDTEPEIGEYIGDYQIGMEQKFITDATRVINGWDISEIKKKEEIKKNKEEKKEVETNSDDNVISSQKVSAEEFEELQRKYEALSSMIEDIKKSKGAKVTNAIKEEEKRQENDDFEKELKQTPKNKTHVLAVYSGKGGTGKTTIASQIAVSLSKTPMHRGFAKVCLIDFDFELGDVSNLFNLPEYTNEPLDDFIVTVGRNGMVGEEDIERLTFIPEGLGDISSEGSLRILPAPRKFTDSRVIKPETIDEAVNALRDTGYFDFIVCDTGNNLNKASLAALYSSDVIYVVYTPDFTTIKCNDSVIDALLDIDEEVFEDKFKAIINRATRRSGLTAEKIENSLKANLGIEVVGVIGPDEDVTYCNNYRIPISLDKSKNFYSEIQPIIKDIVGENYVLPNIEPEKPKIKEETKKFGGFFKNLFKKKK